MGITFPNESAEYRAARDQLAILEREANLAQVRLNDARRALPAGGEVPSDYRFDRQAADGTIETVRMADLFPASGGPLIVYSMMFGPERKVACPFCTAYLSNLDRAAGQLGDKATFVVAARSPLPRLIEHAQAQGWQNLVMVSDGASTFHAD